MTRQPFDRVVRELDYPIYGCEFDPLDSGRLVVGGGGGAGRSGVGNKITILDASIPGQLLVAAELDLSRDEDSVSSLAIGHRRGPAGLAANTNTTTLLYAGINSAPEALAEGGRNEHLRVFALGGSKPARAAAGTATASPRIEELSRVACFDPDGLDPDPGSYQRLLRLSGPGAGPGALGVAASALGRSPQLALFEIPAEGRPRPRGRVPLDREAEDVDVISTGGGCFQVAYCAGYELSVVDVAAAGSRRDVPTTPQPRVVYTIPDDDPARPIFRSIRYLTPTFILAVANLPQNRGAVIQVYRLPPPPPPGPNPRSSGPSRDPPSRARLSISARIPGRAKASRVAVCNLTPAPPFSPTRPPPARIGDTQFLVAVAGQDSSISLFTLEHRTAHSIELLADLLHLRTLRTVHGTAQITALSFSAPPPAHPAFPKASSAGPRPPAVVKLASTSLERSVSVHHIPLRPFSDKSASSREGGAGPAGGGGAGEPTWSPPRLTRYVVAARYERLATAGTLAIVAAVVVLLVAVLGQGLLEMYGLGLPIMHAQHVVPWTWNPLSASPPPPAQPRSPPPLSPPSQGNFWESLLHDVGGSAAGAPDRRILLRSDVCSSAQEPGVDVPIVQAAVVHLDGAEDAGGCGTGDGGGSSSDGEAREGVEWSELTPSERTAWKQRLKGAGHWVEAQGEAVFKGVLFGELAGAVGRAMMR